MPQRRRGELAITIGLVVVAALVILSLSGLNPFTPPPPDPFYELSTKVYTATVGPATPTVAFGASGFEGPFILGANTSGVSAAATLRIGGEVAFRGNLTDLQYAYLYATSFSASSNVLLALAFPQVTSATVVTLQLATRTDLAVAPAISGGVSPSPDPGTLAYPSMDKGLEPAPDGLPFRQGNWTWDASISYVCNGYPTVVHGGFWFNVTAPEDVPFTISVDPGWSRGVVSHAQVSGNVTFHAHAPATLSPQIQWNTCIQAVLGTLWVTVDAA